jgi:hypothetical protein
MKVAFTGSLALAAFIGLAGLGVTSPAHALTLNFDENGNFSCGRSDPSCTTAGITFAGDVAGGGVRFNLPGVTSGGVPIYEPGGQILSDVLVFAANVTGGGSTLTYYSLDSTGDAADVGPKFSTDGIQFFEGFFAIERANGTFSYCSAGDPFTPPCGGNLYNGVSGPSPTPLPAALPLFAAGFGGLGLLGWRRKRKAHAAVVAG